MNTCRRAQRCRLVRAVYIHVCHKRRETEKRFLGKAPRRRRLEALSVQLSNRKNVITKGIKVRETTPVTRLCRFRRRPDAEFKYRRKYSAFDSRNCCIRHLSPLTLPLKDSFAAVAFSSCGCQRARREREKEKEKKRESRRKKQRSYPLSASFWKKAVKSTCECFKVLALACLASLFSKSR